MPDRVAYDNTVWLIVDSGIAAERIPRRWLDSGIAAECLLPAVPP
jgi:hypothetical protein